MLRSDSSLTMLIVAAVLALGIGYYVPQTLSSRPVEAAKSETPPKEVAQGTRGWAASAPGRVEPFDGEVHIGAVTGGRIAEVLVARNDRVAAGDLLLRLDDEEMLARLASATAEAAIRKRERDANDAVGKPAQDRRTAEDTLAAAERQLHQAREDLDRQLRSYRRGGTGEADLDKTRAAVPKAVERLDQARAGLRKALAADGLPVPTRGEAALAAARADLSAVEAALEKTRIRAAADGTVLVLNAKIGETAVPSPENVLVATGDLTRLRVRAEFEERDFPKVRVGQTAVIRSDAFPGRDFEGSVAQLAKALGPSRLGQRGPRKPTDVDVLEGLINLAGQPELLAGMRVDVFIKPDAKAPAAAVMPRSGGAQATAAARAN
jgi:HlyD family secretion protein